MDQMLFISMSGAKEVMHSQANNANNLANANTDGFKQDFNQFRAQHVQGPGWESRAYAMNERVATDFSVGPVKVTGRELDVMVNRDGYMAIQSPLGDTAYTRTLSLQIDNQGNLVDMSGNMVLNEGGAPINVPPFQEIKIGGDGTVSIITADEPNAGFVAIDRLSTVNPEVENLEKGLDGFIRFTGDGVPPQVEAEVMSGALEASNVNTVEALANMIQLSRKYEMQVKMMKTAKTHSDKSDTLLKIS